MENCSGGQGSCGCRDGAVAEEVNGLCRWIGEVSFEDASPIGFVLRDGACEDSRRAVYEHDEAEHFFGVIGFGTE